MSQEKESLGEENRAFEGKEEGSGGLKLDSVDLESDGVRKIKTKSFPKSVLFIVCNEFCERFSFYGLRTILALYLKYKLDYDNDLSTVIYHVFIMMCYFFPILGAIIADSWLGKFRTIFYLSIVYALGNIVVSTASVPDLIPQREFTMLGLVLIAMGTGGIKPCVSAFGGDQYVLPEQEDQLQKFFSLFYFAINSGSLVSTFLTPILREDVKCFDDDSCYPLAFGIPAILMILSLVIFTAGKRWYKIKKPEGNVIVKVFGCIWYAIKKKSKGEKEHWLYKADDKYEKQFIQDIIATLRVLVLYIPLPIFWALFDQQGSRWTFQATRMNVDVAGLKIKPDQMQVVNPVLILLFIPLFDSLIYPLFEKCNLLKRPLQRLTVGGLLAAAAFGISALVEIELEKTYPILPDSGEGQLRLINISPKPTKASLTFRGDVNEFDFKRMEIKEFLHLQVNNFDKVSLNISTESINLFHIEIKEEKASTFFYSGLANNKGITVIHENIDKSQEGDPKLMLVLAEELNQCKKVTLKSENNEFSYKLNSSTLYKDFFKLSADTYTIEVEGEKIKDSILLQQGGIYSLIITNGEAGYNRNLLTITEPNSVSILWLIPQYIIITAGEVMFSVTGLEFSFTQAPVTMKSLMQAIWLFSVGIGNLIVVVIAKSKVFKSQKYEFLLFGGLMLLDMIIFAFMAMKYTYVEDLKKDEYNEIELDESKSHKSTKS